MKLDTATADRLRELGATDDMLKWLEQPEAVRTLLEFIPMDADRDGDTTCPSCDVSVWPGSNRAPSHGQDCAIAAAWRALGDPRGAEDIERAWDEAISEASRRSDGPRLTGHSLAQMIERLAAPLGGLAQTPYGRITQAQRMLREGLIDSQDFARLLQTWAPPSAAERWRVTSTDPLEIQSPWMNLVNGIVT